MSISYKSLIIFFVLVGASACAIQPAAFNPVIKKNSDKLYFSGRGASAGVMLMSALGPAGIAVGMSIDVGIAKDISKTAKDGGVVIEAIVRESLRKQAANHPILNDATVVIERYGFLAQNGGDKIVAQLHLRVSTSSGSQPQLIKYPEDFSREQDTLPNDDFEKVKTDAVSIGLLWQYAADRIYSIINNKSK